MKHNTSSKREWAAPENADFNLLQYAKMQKQFYALAAAQDPDEIVVGNYSYHENFPYESLLLFKHGDIRKPLFDDFGSRRAFDICCGEGRMVRRMQRFFAEVDGADLSEQMIEYARERTKGSHFYLTNGFNAGDAPTEHYDFVYCTISLQHICVYSIRDLIIKDLCRILKREGKMTLQFLFSRNYPLLPVTAKPLKIADGVNYVDVFQEDSHHAKWFDEKTAAKSTNSGCDVLIGENDLTQVRDYFRRYFDDVEFWFHDISISRGQDRQLPATHPNSHLGNNYWGTHFIFIHLSGKR